MPSGVGFFVRRIIDTLTGLYDLARLGLISGFKMKGAYWRWRLHTAFGRGEPPRPEMIRGILDYARWIRRMRRLM